MKKKKVTALLLAMSMVSLQTNNVLGMNEDYYSDIKTTNDNFSYIEKVTDRGLMTEVTNKGEFRAEEDITQEDFLKALYTLADKPEVTVEDKEKSVEETWAESVGLFKKIDDFEFDKEKGITRQDMAAIYKIFVELRGIIGTEISDENILDGYSDTEDIADYAIDGMKFVVKHDLVRAEEKKKKGKSVQLLNPKKNATRADVAYLLAQYIDIEEKALCEIKDEVAHVHTFVDDYQVIPFTEVGHEENEIIQESYTEEVKREEKSHKERVEVSPAVVVNVEHPEEGHWEEIVTPEWEETIVHEEEGHEEVIVLQPEYTETVEHPEEGHYEEVTTPAWVEKISHEEEGHWETMTIEEAYDETVHHEAETEQKWVVDKEAYTETVKHPEEGHWETVTTPAWNEEIPHEEEGHWEEVVVKEAYDETVHHDAVTKQKWVIDKEAYDETVHHDAVTEQKWVIDKEAYDETVTIPEEGHLEERPVVDGYYCNTCGEKMSYPDEHFDRDVARFDAGEITADEIHGGSHSNVIGYENVWVVDKPASTETIHHDEEGHYETVVVKEAYDEVVHHDEEGHWEEVVVKEAYDETVHHDAVTEQKWIVDKEAYVEKIEHPEESKQVWVVDKEAWTEEIFHKEEGHWETVVIKEAYDEVIHHEAVTEEIWVIEKEAYVEIIEHPAETKTVWIVDKEAWTEEIFHPAETKTVWIVEKEGYTETIVHPEKVTRVWVVDAPAWTEKVVIKEAVYEERTIIDEPYWEEKIFHPAQYRTIWVVDKAAHTEIVKTGKVCTGCGKKVTL